MNSQAILPGTTEDRHSSYSSLSGQRRGKWIAKFSELGRSRRRGTGVLSTRQYRIGSAGRKVDTLPKPLNGLAKRRNGTTYLIFRVVSDLATISNGFRTSLPVQVTR